MLNPRHYANNLDPFINITREVYNKYGKLHLSWGPEPVSVLDLGIGDGRITNEVFLPSIPVEIKEYIGADISENTLKCTRATVTHDKFFTLVIDATTENLPSIMKNRFDYIFANFLLHRVRDVRAVLTNIKDMLKPGGQLFFNTYEKAFNDDAYDKLDQGIWAKYEHYKALSPFYRSENATEEYKEIIKSLGYVNCHFYAEKIKPQLPESSFEEFFTTVNSRLPFVNEEDRESYMKDFLEATKKCRRLKIISLGPNEEKIYEMHFDIITGIITKPAHS